MMGAYMFTCTLCRPWAGQLISRYGAATIMRLLVFINAGCLVMYTLPEGSLLWLWGLRALQGAITAFFSMTMQLGIVEKLSEQDRAQGISLYTLSTMFPQLFAPMIAVTVWKSGEWSSFVVICRFVLRKSLPSDGRWDMRLIAGLLLSAAIGSQLLAMLEVTGLLVYVSAICNGLAIALLYPTLVTYLTFALPSRCRALLLGLFISSYDLGFSLGGVMMGMVAQWFSYSGMFTICAVISLSALLVVFLNKDRMSLS